MKEKFGFKQLIILTIAYLAFISIDLVLDQATGIHWISPRNFSNTLALICIGVLWIWYLVDKIRRK